MVVQSLFAEGRTSQLFRLRSGLVKKKLKDCGTTNKLNRIIAPYYPENKDIAPVVYHEVNALIQLQKYGIAPKVIDVGKDFFIMTNAGAPVNKKTQFVDLEKRVQHILYALDSEGITHNDLRRDFRNYTHLNGVLHLVDFQISDIGDIKPGAAIRKGKEHFYNNNQEDLEWFIANFQAPNKKIVTLY